MPKPPSYDIDLAAFWDDPYPDLKTMQCDKPVAFVPQLGATLLTRRDDIFENEKKIDVFSSHQPGGLMTVLMGENMMRKDGMTHMAERRAIFPTVSPRTVRDVWKAQFEQAADAILSGLRNRTGGDLVQDFAMPVSAEALKAITGLTNMHFAEMNRVSQGMIDGCANYRGDPRIEAHCHECTASIDRHIDERLEAPLSAEDLSLLAVQRRAGLSQDQLRANTKLAISGGQNEPRDAIAGTVWAVLTHPDQLAMVLDGHATWMQAFEEYARWISPIGMSPRRVAKPYRLHEVELEPESRVFLMFGAGNRDPRAFENPDAFDITRDVGPSLAFGAGPHFCAGAWASRCLIAEVALPRLFAALPGLRLDPDQPTRLGGWAFRGPLRLPCLW